VLEPGKVYLVGAGPGDAELITVRGLRCLRGADVVVYDRLIDPMLLEEAPATARRIYVGKAAGRHAMSQERINAVLIRQALEGHGVVRLKGGDPFVFGRGGEEAEALALAGIPYEIVPGVTSAVAVPAYAGIPVTQRGVASSFTVVTGHDCASSGVDWEGLAHVPGTLVILMVIERLPQIVERLMRGGMAATTAAAAIASGSTPVQRVVRARLCDLAERVADEAIEAPAVIVIGAVAALAETLAWFTPHAVATSDEVAALQKLSA
jgi:uroporphyrin-III C-methyltransferase